MRFKHNGAALVLSILSEALTPPEPVTPSAWAVANLIVPDGPKAGERWSLDLTPYLREPLDLLGPDSGVNQIAVMKSAQTGFTTLLIAIIGHTVDRDPCRMMLLQPTDAALSDFNRDKLQPAIDASEVLAAKVVPQLSRSSQGSTTYSKRYPGGSLTLAIATSAADLSSKTIRKLFRDEIDRYPDDLDGQGSPLDISDGRLLAFLEEGTWRKADISTPTVMGASKIEKRYAAGDQRRWHVRCPHCDDGEFVLDPRSPSFEFERTFPHGARYVTPCCGIVIPGDRKAEVIRNGRWVATAPRPGAFPSFHLDVLSSPFVPWEETAAQIVAAGDDPHALKTLHNLWFGLPYEIKGDAPDHKRLMERREDGWERGHVPPRGIVLVAAADVQMRGLWVEIIAMAPNRETWVVDAFYCDGSTEAPDGEGFTKLLALTVDREFPDAFGRMRKVDGLAIDSGYRSHAVYAFVRQHQRLHPDTGQDVLYAVKGDDGWGRPAMGLPTLVDISLDGRRLKQGCKLWPVGTWPLKGAFYADLRKEGARAGAERDPDGFCHFPGWLDETYFRQITAEHLAEEMYRGRPRKVWKVRSSEKDNHLLDARVYCLALLEHLGVSSFTSTDWASLIRRRGSPELEPSLFTSAKATEEARTKAETDLDLLLSANAALWDEQG